MRKISLAFIFALCALSLTAQDAIKVNFKGSKPTIYDFAWAFLFSDEDDEDECDQEATAGFEQALLRYSQGLPPEEGTTFIVDEKNGYILYEWTYDESDYMLRAEMCYWNEADGKHKLFAYSSWLFEDGKPHLGQYDGVTFMRYNNATKRMSYCSPPGFEVEYYNSSYSLPRTGKDIIFTKWNDDGTKQEKTLKWNGRRFSY